ncbi:peptide-methionine (S)-S-oxide reductase [Abditibacterium utsteinense]|uniref:Peptide methionine sulfoxide reductase MsrA n=1 Tax=Abditibacterium utsteinense TaxID=1960156 RepID=A0A2S8STM9_9BACT|nr:peptide-methionine (S)-S-oxide reductase MsrA [Abditibacterium utsteinense]PQV64099.1 peptide-methionine (S)-S-oxide reductase [Abditibacterium utsteinense]
MNTQNITGAPWLRMLPLALVAGVAGLATLGAAKDPVDAEVPVAAKAPLAAPRAQNTLVSAKIPQGLAVATLGGGCFWSMEALYKRVKGVRSATPGYAGGKLANPSYEQVGSGSTGHAESLNIVYDPKVVSYGELVDILLTVLDPTTLNQQGGDVGTNYRSVIFTRSHDEKQIAEKEIQKINAKHIWKAPIVTQVVPIKAFYRAEDYHQNYYDTHQEAPYCQAVIEPKLDKLRAKFGDKLK